MTTQCRDCDPLAEDFTTDPPTLFDRELDRPWQIEQALDQMRTRLDNQSVQLGRGLPSADNAPLAKTFQRSARR